MTEETVLHAPPVRVESRGDTVYAISPDLPHWIATDERGARILSYVDGQKTFGQIMEVYATETRADLTRAWLHCHTFLQDAMRRKIVSTRPFVSPPYLGRAAHLKPETLRELWIHTNNSCNLTCAHCLVSSGPHGDGGPSTGQLEKLIDDARALGVERFYFTGGEPMLRKDFWDLVDHVTAMAELAVLTNATLLSKEHLDRLERCDRRLLKLQASLDGSRPEINDPIRGKGSFDRTLAGIRNAVKAGFTPTLTAVVTKRNVRDLPNMARLAASLELKAVHFLWMHKKGRAALDAEMGADVPQIIEALMEAQTVADEVGVYIDNIEAVKTRLGGLVFSKLDLSNACWESLCVYADGNVYPSAATVQIRELRLGNAFEKPLKEIWLNSPMAKKMREASVEKMAQCRGCRFKFICGGGDIEHRYFYSRQDQNGDPFHGDDPYCDVYQHLITTAMNDLAKKGDPRNGKKTGFDAPVGFASMGDVRTHDFGLNASPAGGEGWAANRILVKHSNCVLAFDLDTYRKPVRDFYGMAAEKPQTDLCCPVKYNSEFLDHIPKEAIEVFYGCGGPMQEADVQEGMTVLDLGSGGGIDCFIAAKRVGPGGRVIGVDMTDEMLERAERSRRKVAKNLGYDNVEFRKGFLESVPVEDASVDLVTSNCVINLSPDKRKVFREIWRVLRDHAAVHISDIVTEQELPLHLATNERLVGECVGQALTEAQFLSFLEQAGFYGITVTKKFFWKEIEGYPIYSITVRGQKFEKKKSCVFTGQKAIYHGPYKAVVDEEGHLFPRNEPVEVCTDTAAKLSKPPYNAFFTITAADGSVEHACCPAGSDGAACC